MAEKKTYRLRENKSLTECVQPEYEAAQFDGTNESITEAFPEAVVREHEEGKSAWVEYHGDMFLVSLGDYVVDCIAADRFLVLSESAFEQTFVEGF